MSQEEQETMTFGRRKSDSLTFKLLIAFELATLALSVYAISSMNMFHSAMAKIDREGELKAAILAQKLEDDKGCSMDRPGGIGLRP